MDQLELVKEKIAEIEVEKYRGALMRARAEKYSLGEQPTKRALSAEAKYAKEKYIAEIEYSGVQSSRPDIIETAFIEYYSNLSRQEKCGSDSQIEDYLKVMPRLSDKDKERLEEPIGVVVTERAIDELPPKKSPF